MRHYISNVIRKISLLLNDDRGDNENLGRMLILALVLVPLVVLVTFFGGQIYDKGVCTFNQMINNEADANAMDECAAEEASER